MSECTVRPKPKMRKSRAKAKPEPKYIEVHMWTEAEGSSMETAATSITAAVKVIRRSLPYYKNWSLEFRSEVPK